MGRPRIPAALLYAILGVGFGFGAPTGLLLLRLLAFGVRPAAELGEYAVFYVYTLVGTSLVFGLFGFAAGRREDRLQKSRDHFEALANVDPLTQLANARAFWNQYRRTLEHARSFDEPLALLTVDVDTLKDINERFGHSAGSAALRHVAESLRLAKREGDVAARWGGDEFGILMRDAPEGAARRVAEAIRDRLHRHPLRHEGETIPVTVTIGIATRPPGQEANLFEKADAALLAGKKAGRDRISNGALD